jgi:hypothetical protein
MSRRLMLLNVILLAVVITGVVRLSEDIRAFSAAHRVDQIRPDSDKPLPKAIGAPAAAARQDWPDIAAHNPFSFDRNDVAIVVTPPAAQQPKRPKPLLFGTMMVGKDFLALLGPGDAPAKSSRAVHSGETFDGWTVVEIQDKTVTVKWEEVKETLIMNDPTAQVARDYTKTGSSATATPAVVTVAPAAAPPAAAASAPSTSSLPQPVATSPTGKRPCVIQTPFGPKTLEDCNQ